MPAALRADSGVEAINPDGYAILVLHHCLSRCRLLVRLLHLKSRSKATVLLPKDEMVASSRREYAVLNEQLLVLRADVMVRTKVATHFFD